MSFSIDINVFKARFNKLWATVLAYFWRGILGTELLNILLQLYSSGGIEICTPNLEVRSPSSPDAAQRYWARTVIQPDAHVIAYVDQEILKREDIWQQHVQRVNKKLRFIEQLNQQVTRRLEIISLSLFALFWVGYYSYTTELETFLEDTLRSLLEITLSVLITYVVTYTLRWALRRYVKQQLNTILANVS